MPILDSIKSLFAEKKTDSLDMGQIDQTREEITPLDKKLLIRSLGDDGTSLTSGYLNDEYNRLFQGRTAYDTYDEMYRSDSTIGKMLLAAQLPIVGADFCIHAHKQKDETISSKDQEIADFVHKCLFEMPNKTWSSFMWECVQMIRDGVSVFEIVMTMSGENYILKELAVRKPKSIMKRETADGQPGITQILPQGKVDTKEATPSIPASKLLIFSFRKEGKNYAGLSILRQVGKNRVAKKELENFELMGYEAQFRGVRKMRTPSSMSKTDKETYLESVAAFEVGSDNSIILPGTKDEFDFEFASMAIPQAQDIANAINRHDGKITDALLGFFMKLGESQKGSYGMAESNKDFFILGLEYIAGEICDVINNFLVKKLVDLNFGPQEGYPQLSYGDLDTVNVGTVVQAIKDMTESGHITPDMETEQFVRDLLDMPRKSADAPADRSKKKTNPDSPSDFHEGCGCGSCQIDTIFADFLGSPTLEFADISEEQVKRQMKFSDTGEYRRPLTFAELKVNIPQVKKKIEALEKKMSESFSDITKRQKDSIIQQVKTAVENNDISALDRIQVPHTDEMNQLIQDIRKEAFDYGKDSASAELSVQAVQTTAEQKAYMIAESGQIASKVADKLKGDALSAVNQEIARNGGAISTLTSASAIKTIGSVMDDTITKSLSGLTTIGVVGTMNTGRGATFASYPEKIYAFQYSSIIDGRTTDRCLSLDGRVVLAGSAEYSNYSPPQHYGCRSMWVAIASEETFKPKITGIPSSITSVTNINTDTTVDRPYIAKGSPALSILRQELQEREQKLKLLEESGTYPNRQEQHKARIAVLKKSLGKN